MPTDWARARAILAPLAQRAVDDPPSDVDLLEASLEAFSLKQAAMAPLVAWSAP